MDEHKPSTDIMPTYYNASADELRTLCANWIDTAAMHLRNEEYWRQRALKAEGKTPEEIQGWGH